MREKNLSSPSWRLKLHQLQRLRSFLHQWWVDHQPSIFQGFLVRFFCFWVQSCQKYLNSPKIAQNRIDSLSSPVHDGQNDDKRGGTPFLHTPLQNASSRNGRLRIRVREELLSSVFCLKFKFFFYLKKRVLHPCRVPCVS